MTHRKGSKDRRIQCDEKYVVYGVRDDAIQGQGFNQVFVRKGGE
jgi:hypothetical protein